MLKPVIEFYSYVDWGKNRSSIFTQASLESQEAVCIDELGRPCVWARDFHQAHLDNAYPVRVYRVADVVAFVKDALARFKNERVDASETRPRMTGAAK